MAFIKQAELKRKITGKEAIPLRTDDLEKRIKIGVGFHKKWYRSQKEYWLSWIVAKEREPGRKGAAMLKVQHLGLQEEGKKYLAHHPLFQAVS